MGAVHALPMSSFEVGNVAMHVSNGPDSKVWRRPFSLKFSFESIMGGSQCTVTISFKIGLLNSWNSSMHDFIISEESESASERDSSMMVSIWLSSSWLSRVAWWDWLNHWGKGATCLYGSNLDSSYIISLAKYSLSPLEIDSVFMWSDGVCCSSLDFGSSVSIFV